QAFDNQKSTSFTTSPPLRVERACKTARSRWVARLCTEPSAYRNWPVAGWGLKKLSGSEDRSLSEWEPVWANGWQGESATAMLSVGAPGVMCSVPSQGAPHQRVRVNRAARSPTASVLLEPSAMSARRMRLVRKNRPC